LPEYYTENPAACQAYNFSLPFTFSVAAALFFKFLVEIHKRENHSI